MEEDHLKELVKPDKLFEVFQSEFQLDNLILETLMDLVQGPVEVAIILLWDTKLEGYQVYCYPEKLSQGRPNFINVSTYMSSFWGSVSQPLYIPDLSKEGINLEPFVDLNPFYSSVFVPISIKRKNLGALAIFSSERGAFSYDFLQTLASFSFSLGLALENQRLIQENKNTLQQLKAVIDVSRRVNTYLNLEDAVQAVIQSTKELFNLDKVGVYLFEESGLVLAGKDNLGTVFSQLQSLLNSRINEISHQWKPFSIAEADVDFLRESSISNCLLFPISYQKKSLGYLALLLPKGRVLLPEEMLVAQSLANQCAVAIENAKLFSEIQSRTREFATLFDLAKVITSSLKIEEITKLILESAQKLVSADEGFIMEVSPNSEELIPLAATGPYEREIMNVRIKVGEGITGWVAQTGIGENLAQAELDPRVKQINGTPLEEESLIALPLKIRDQVIGVMAIYRLRHQPFSEREFDLLTIFSSLAASSIYNARLFQATSEMAITDYLTGLYNYRYFFRRLQEELSYAQRYHQKLTLVYMDIDQFKKYNDRYGHLEGDRVLARCGQSLRESVRASDVVFRYGGDEFAIILPSTDAAEAKVVIERIKEKISADFPQGEREPITVSVGFAVYPDDALEAEALLKIADQLMYTQKRPISISD